MLKGVSNYITLNNLLINVYEKICITLLLSHYPFKFIYGQISKGVYIHWIFWFDHPLERRGGWENILPNK